MAASLSALCRTMPLAAFTALLSAGDILAIDSSHVIRAGSDVQYLLNEVLPELAAGVPSMYTTSSILSNTRAIGSRAAPPE